MPSNHTSRAATPALLPVAPGVHALRDVFVNLYYVAADPAQPRGAWVLVDAGLPGSAGKIVRHAAELFGPNHPPQAIVLTHGHFDHVGALHGLLAAWPQVPVYAHELELPYLTGRSAYPAPDPTVGGGLMAWSSFLYPNRAYDFRPRVLPLPDEGNVPGLPEWRWLATPGHTPGHVSFFRESDRLLLAGDAITTVRGESALATLTQKQEVHGPPAYFTPDWDAARRSVQRLAALHPNIAATGHGIAMHGPTLRQELARLAQHFDELARPRVGRYAQRPAVADATGVVSVPPRLVRPWMRALVVAGLAAGATALLRRGQSVKS